ncbi:hypothetical protein E2320_001955, partial [Naja naja]
MTMDTSSAERTQETLPDSTRSRKERGLSPKMLCNRGQERFGGQKMRKGFKVLVCGMCSVGKTAILEQVLYGNRTT